MSRQFHATQLTLLLSSILAASSADAQTYYVDPVNGQDVSSAGSLSNPFKSVTYALAQRTQAQLHLYLRRGDYSTLTGEVFPISIDQDTSIEGVGYGGVPVECRGARFVFPSNSFLTGVFQCSAPSGATSMPTVAFRNLSIDTGHRGVWITGPAIVSVADVDVVAFRGVDVSMPPQQVGSPTLTMERCRVRAVATQPPTNGAAIQLYSQSVLGVNIHACDISAGPSLRAVVATSANIGGVQMNVESCVIHDSLSGVYAQLEVGVFASATISVKRCTFWGNALGAPGEAALVNASGSGIQFDGGANLFDSNGPGLEMLALSGGSWALVTNNRVQVMATTNGNFQGPVYLADPAAGDFHLQRAPVGSTASAVIDRSISGPPNLVYSFDIDGGPRQACSGTPGPADIGADEYEEPWVYVNPPLRLGQSSVIATFSDGAIPEGYLIFAGTGPTVANPCTGGSFVLQNAQLIASGVVPSSHRAAINVQTPATPVLLGAPFVLQSAMYNPTTQAYRISNLEVEPIRP